MPCCEVWTEFFLQIGCFPTFHFSYVSSVISKARIYRLAAVNTQLECCRIETVYSGDHSLVE